MTMQEAQDIVAVLQGIEERLRDLAYERLRSAAEGDEQAAVDEKKVLQARRAVERAIHALGGSEFGDV
jgi:hypothetical protein